MAGAATICNEQQRAAMPVTVLTGFLGAGKTTLLNRILSAKSERRLGVLVNDFGELSVDAELIVGVKSGQIELTNGCVCCEIRDDLMGSIGQLMSSQDELEGILLEASGVADPAGLVRTFTAPAYRDAIRLDSITAVVDAEHLPAQAEDPATRDLVFSQIGYSDLVILNKIDLANRTAVAEIRKWMVARLPALRIVEATRCDVPTEILIGDRSRDPTALAPAEEPTDGDLGRPDAPGREERDHDPHGHTSSFVSWVYRRSEPLDEQALEQVIPRLPSSVYRMKGWLHSARAPEKRMLVQAVGMRGEISEHDRWRGRDAVTELVLGAEAKRFDPAEVEALLDGCIRS